MDEGSSPNALPPLVPGEGVLKFAQRIGGANTVVFESEQAPAHYPTVAVIGGWTTADATQGAMADSHARPVGPGGFGGISGAGSLSGSGCPCAGAFGFNTACGLGHARFVLYSEPNELAHVQTVYKTPLSRELERRGANLEVVA